MKLHRFFIEQPLGEEIVVKEKKLIHQWNNVLKFKKGESLILFNSSHNKDYTYSIVTITKNEANLHLQDEDSNLNQKEEENAVNLCISLIKKDNLDLILQKCTELGVSEYTPLISDRVEKKNISSWNKERGEKIIIEAVEQSGWGNIPKINDPIKLEDLLKNLDNKGGIENVIVMDISDNKKDTFNYKKETKKYLLVGPEGGWTEEERELFRKYKLNTLSFGKNVLRAETAAIVGSYSVLK